MDVSEKLGLLADASRYDLSCACGTRTNDDHRRRGADGLWVYPVSLPRGGTSIMLKTLLSSSCVNDCGYCPLRSDQDFRRCTLSPDDMARAFMEFVQRGRVFGLFLSSGVMKDPDFTMDRLTAVARILRSRHAYRGYIHLKVIPGASDAAVEEAVRLASAVSLNVEVPTARAFRDLSQRKDFHRDIVRPMKLISSLTAPGSRHARVKQSTQFVVGASRETDSEIVEASFRLYGNLGLSRIYFSAYQRGLGAVHLPGERNPDVTPEKLLTREHRLYQTDFLIRQYRWNREDFSFDESGNLPLDADPKELWARRHPDFFPVNIRTADKETLLRVPGLGPVTVRRIMRARKESFIRDLRDLGLKGKRLQTVAAHTVTG